MAYSLASADMPAPAPVRRSCAVAEGIRDVQHKIDALRTSKAH